MTKRRRRTNNSRPLAKQATSAPPRHITQLRLLILDAAVGRIKRHVFFLCPDEGRRTYRSLATVAASIRPQRPSTLLRRLLLT